MTEEKAPIFLEKVTPFNEEFIANGIVYVLTVKEKSKPLTIPNVGSEQDDT
jgi:hypothetical protein